MCILSSRICIMYWRKSNITYNELVCNFLWPSGEAALRSFFPHSKHENMFFEETNQPSDANDSRTPLAYFGQY